MVDDHDHLRPRAITWPAAITRHAAKGPAASRSARSRGGDGFLLHVVGEQRDGVLAAELVVEAADELLRVGVHGLVADAFVLGRVVGRIRAMEQRVKLAEGGGIFEVLKDE